MTKGQIVAVAGLAVAVLGVVAEADAASARARCRVRDGRVRIQVDGRGLAPGAYTATVVNAATSASAVSKLQTATPIVRNLDFDFDSTAGPADKDTFVPAGFLAQGQGIQVTVNPGALVTSTACKR